VLKEKINQTIDRISEFLAFRKGLLPMIGILLILINWILQLFPGSNWLANTNSLLHLGAVVAIIGFLAAWAL
jgi:hypothetical protein